MILDPYCMNERLITNEIEEKWRIDMSFANALQRLRKERKMTQGELARFLSVSVQTISKWETAGGYPEITIIPRIASFFEISIDELLGVSEIKSELYLKDLHRQWTKNNADQKDTENIALLREAIKEYPGDFLLLAELTVSLEKVGDKTQKLACYEEAIEISERILKYCKDRTLCNDVEANLCCLYDKVGQKEKAIQTAGKLPNLYKCREVTLLPLQSGREKQLTAQKTLLECIWGVQYALTALEQSDLYSSSEKEFILKRSQTAIDAIFTKPLSVSISFTIENQLLLIPLLIENQKSEEALCCIRETLRLIQKIKNREITDPKDTLLFSALDEDTLSGCIRKTKASYAQRLYDVLKERNLLDENDSFLPLSVIEQIKALI